MMKTKHTLVHICLLLRFVATRESYLIVRRQPLFRPLVHYIIVRPAIEVGWLDIMLAQQRGYMRTMIDGVVDGLDQHDDARSIIGPPVQMEDLAQFPLFRDRETQVRPEVILKKVGKSGGHCSDLLP